MRFSASSDFYRHLDFREACREIKKAGLEGVDVWSSPGMCEHLNPEHPAKSARGVMKTVRENGLSAAAVTAYYSLAPGSPERLLKTVECAALMEAPCVVTNAAGWKGPLESFGDAIRPAVDLAEKCGVRIAFENNSSEPFGKTVEDLLFLARFMDSSAFGFTVAPPHFVLSGEDPAEAVRALAGRVFFFYAWDHVPGADDDGEKFTYPFTKPEYLFPGNGELDFGAFLGALEDVGYPENAGGWVNIRAYPRYCAEPWDTGRITLFTGDALRHLQSLK